MRTAWEQFQQGEESAGVRPEILTSWRRSQLSGVDPEHVDLPWQQPAVDTRFARSAIPVLTRLADLLVGTGTSLVITDSGGRVLWRCVSDRALRRELDEMAIVEGFSFGEEHAGTNGLGTSLESRRVTTVRGGEHFKAPFHRFTCVAAPVTHPLTRRVVGGVNITCRAADANERLQPALLALAREVQQALLHAAGNRERALFDAFLQHARATTPVITLGPEVLIKNDAAAGIDVDHHRLWQRVLDAAEQGGPLHIPELDARTAQLKTIAEGSRISGAVLVLDQHKHRPSAAATAQQRVAAAVGRLLCEPGAVVVRGAAGTGKQYVLTDRLITAGHPYDVLDCATATFRELPAGVRRAADTGRALVLTHLQALSPEHADALTTALTGPPAPVLGTITAERADDTAHLTRLLDALEATVLELPPLQLRGDELDQLVAAVTPAGIRWSERATAALHEHTWPGNIAELKLAVRTAAASATGSVIGLEHLPGSVRAAAGDRRLSLLEQAEADVITEVLAASGGNKAAAARRLGLSRPTLYAKLRAYRI